MPSRPTLPREVDRSWDRARWINEVRRFDTAWDVDAPRSENRPRLQPEAPIAESPSVETTQVTLVVYEWQNAEPGTLSWQFADRAAALNAARALRNAVAWVVIAGHETDVDVARAHGKILIDSRAHPSDS